MVKIGLEKQYEFEHSLLAKNDRLKTCVLYKAEPNIPKILPNPKGH